jgi:hypothetical protein
MIQSDATVSAPPKRSFRQSTPTHEDPLGKVLKAAITALSDAALRGQQA